MIHRSHHVGTLKSFIAFATGKNAERSCDLSEGSRKGPKRSWAKSSIGFVCFVNYCIIFLRNENDFENFGWSEKRDINFSFEMKKYDSEDSTFGAYLADSSASKTKNELTTTYVLFEMEDQ
uniref:Uncharacterized protein n=1 Tax=Vespula pensylvanica TaxID=30213 RepID=A0A834PBR6_VESPE|nr:hypothetical protein H0235_003387 [Vespula pensylvanica]